MNGPALWLLGAILLIIVLRRMQPIVAAVLGIIAGIGAAYWGLGVYAKGGTVGLLTIPLTRTMFLGLIALWLVTEGFNLFRAVSIRKARQRAVDEGQA